MNAIRNLILALLLTFSYLSVVGQQTFEKAYYVEGETNTNLGYYPNYINQNSENDLIIGGYKSLTPESSCTFINKTNSIGEPIWAKTINLPGAQSVIETSDGDFLITSTSYGYTCNKEILLIKINSSNEILWKRSIGSIDIFDNTSCKGYSTKEIDETYYLTVGVTNTYGVGEYDIYVVKTDIDGNNVWAKTYGTPISEGVVDFVQTNDDGFIICGTDDVEFGEDNDVLLIKIDSDGNLLWSKTIGGNLYEVPKKIKRTDSNGYIVIGNYTGPAADTDIFVFETDSLGNLLWSKLFGSILWDYGFDILPLSDGGSVFTGSIQDTTVYSDDVFFAKLSKDGDTVWTKLYGDQFSNYGSAICKTNDNGYAIVGRTENDFGDGENTYPLLIKTDIFGNTNCSNYSKITVTNVDFQVATISLETSSGGHFSNISDCIIEDVTILDSLFCSFAQNTETYTLINKISCYPNPFHESANIFFENTTSHYYYLSIFNSTGKLVRQFSVSNSSEILIKRDGLSDGMYFLQVSDKTNIIGQIKIVIQ